MESKTCTKCKTEKSIINFYEKMQTVETVKLKGFQNVTLIIKIKYQSNGRYNMKKIGIKFYNHKKINVYI